MIERLRDLESGLHTPTTDSNQTQRLLVVWETSRHGARNHERRIILWAQNSRGAREGPYAFPESGPKGHGLLHRRKPVSDPLLIPMLPIIGLGVNRGDQVKVKARRRRNDGLKCAD
jgi:hypothetical protein